MRACRARCATSPGAIDVSDGLVGEYDEALQGIRHVSAMIEAQRVPLSRCGRKGGRQKPALLAELITPATITRSSRRCRKPHAGEASRPRRKAGRPGHADRAARPGAARPSFWTRRAWLPIERNGYEHFESSDMPFHGPDARCQPTLLPIMPRTRAVASRPTTLAFSGPSSRPRGRVRQLGHCLVVPRAPFSQFLSGHSTKRTGTIPL